MARDSETSTNENSNVQGLGPRRPTRLNTMMSGAAPPPWGTTMATTTAATLQQVPQRHNHGPNRAIQAHTSPSPRLDGLSHLSPTQTQCVANPSPSFTLTCATLRAAHSHGPTCSSGQPGGLLSSPNQSKISSIVPTSNFSAYD
ncbi:hypothetical protein TB2_040594 [Malus domestica]